MAGVLYLDTSVLVKLYVLEQHSERVQAWVDASAFIATSAITYVEAHAAFAMAERLGRIDALAAIKQKFQQDWPQLTRVLVADPILKRAADLAEGFGLRAYDSLQLASADKLFRVQPEAFTFASFDQKLNQAAKLLGMHIAEL